MKIYSSLNNITYFNSNINSMKKLENKMNKISSEIAVDKNIPENIVKEIEIKNFYKADAVSIKYQDENFKTILNLKA